MVTFEQIKQAFAEVMEGIDEKVWISTLAEIDSQLEHMEAIRFDEVVKQFSKGRKGDRPASVDFLLPDEKCYFIELKSMDALMMNANFDSTDTIKAILSLLDLEKGDFRRKTAGSLSVFGLLIENSNHLTKVFYFVFEPHNARETGAIMLNLQFEITKLREFLKTTFPTVKEVEIVTGREFYKLITRRPSQK